MKKLLYLSRGQPALQDEPKPVCAADTVLLRTLYTGLSNGTERNQLLAGNYNAKAEFPFRQVGYQNVAEVIERGAAITRFSVGDRVVTGTFGTHAEFHLAKETDLITRLPEGFDLPAGALASLAAVALHNVKRADITASDKVMICGAGLVGLFALQWCKLRGAKVVLLERNEQRAALARSLGADAVGFGDEAAQQAFIAAHRPCSAAFETTGSAAVLKSLVGVNWGEGLFKPRTRPRLVVVAGNWEVVYSGNAAQASELALLHAVHFAQEDLDETVAAIATGTFRVRPLIQDLLPASRIIPTYEALRDNPASLFGTVFDWQSQ